MQLVDNTVEKWYEDNFNMAPAKELSKEQFEFMISLLTRSESDIQVSLDGLRNMPDGDHHLFGFDVITKRCQWLGLEMDLKSRVYLGAFVCETPGEITMYLAIIMAKLKNKEKKVVFDGNFCKELFPWGMYSKEDLSKGWDAQKSPKGSNNLDNELCYTSLTTKQNE